MLRYARLYGITFDERDAILFAQGQCCPICETTDPGSLKGWATDHDHDSMVVRGVPCQRCNQLLGMCGDNLPAVLKTFQNIIRYLTEQPQKTEAVIKLRRQTHPFHIPYKKTMP